MSYAAQRGGIGGPRHGQNQSVLGQIKSGWIKAPGLANAIVGAACFDALIAIGKLPAEGHAAAVSVLIASIVLCVASGLLPLAAQLTWARRSAAGWVVAAAFCVLAAATLLGGFDAVPRPVAATIIFLDIPATMVALSLVAWRWMGSMPRTALNRGDYFALVIAAVCLPKVVMNHLDHRGLPTLQMVIAFAVVTAATTWACLLFGRWAQVYPSIAKREVVAIASDSSYKSRGQLAIMPYLAGFLRTYSIPSHIVAVGVSTFTLMDLYSDALDGRVTYVFCLAMVFGAPLVLKRDADEPTNMRFAQAARRHAKPGAHRR